MPGEVEAGLKAMGAKTPANKAPKTPFKVPLNDENAVTLPGKSLLNTNGKANLSMTVKKNGKLETNSFVTPAGMYHLHRDEISPRMCLI